MPDLINKIKQIINKKFVRSTIVLISGTAISQVILVAASPILSRIYDPAALGVFGLFTAIVSIISMVATWRYEMAIVLPEDDRDAANLFILSGAIALGMTLLSALIIALFGEWISLKLGSRELRPLLWWVPVSVLAFGLYQSLNYWSTRRKHFKRLSISQVFRSIASTGTQTVAGLAGAGSAGLVGGQAGGQIVATVVLGAQIWRDEKNLALKFFNYKRLRELARKYSSFPKYNSWQILISGISYNAPMFLLAPFFGIDVVGFYALTYKVLSAPIDLVGQSVRQVFFQKASEVYNKNGDIYKLLKSTTIGLTLAGIIPSVIIMLFGPAIFSFVFGSKWYIAGIYARWITPWLFFAFINIPAFMLAQVCMLQSYLLIYEIALLLRVLIIWLAAIHSDAVTAIILFSITGAIFNCILIAGMFLLAKKWIKR